MASLRSWEASTACDSWRHADASGSATTCATAMPCVVFRQMQACAPEASSLSERVAALVAATILSGNGTDWFDSLGQLMARSLAMKLTTSGEPRTTLGVGVHYQALTCRRDNVWLQ